MYQVTSDSHTLSYECVTRSYLNDKDCLKMAIFVNCFWRLSDTLFATSLILSLHFSLTLINPRGRVILASLVD